MRRAQDRWADERGSVPNAIARVRREGADSSQHAILVGTRAGVVEWANAAWTEITGCPLDETVEKPITHFLGFAGIELELVDFVAQRFLEGRSCTVQFPYTSSNAGPVEVHLDVQPIRNESGEIDAFVARAGVVPPRPDEDGCVEHGRSGGDRVANGGPESRSASKRGLVTRATARPRPLSLADHARRAAESRLTRHGRRVHIDLDLARDVPELELEANALDRLVEALLDAALDGIGEEWGFVTLATGRTRAARGHVSRVHPVVARPLELAAGSHLFLEVHDTGRTLSPGALARVRRNEPGRSLREIALARGLRLAAELGATLSMDSTPGCGHQSLVLFPIP